MNVSLEALVQAAVQARGRAHAPYSGFTVGAAISDQQGRIWTGANVENASYTLGLCAERVAIFHALTHGAEPGSFETVVVVTGTTNAASPCGACRQILAEFSAGAEVVLVGPGGLSDAERTSVAALLPGPFDSQSLGSSPFT